MQKAFWTKERIGGKVLGFRSESGRFQAVEEEGNTQGRQSLARRLRSNGTQGLSSSLAPACSPPIYHILVIQRRPRE